MAEVFMQKVVVAMSESPDLRRIAEQAAKERFDIAVAELKDDFENSEVTKELDRGVGSPNISHTLRGADASENLFSFIGFDAGDTPTEEIRKRLDPSHDEGPYFQYVGKEARVKSARFQFKAGIQEDKIWDATPMPRAPGLSWAQKIEGKIPGFASFLARFGAGSSGGGIQATRGGIKGAPPQILRVADYQRPDGGYLQTMFRRFLNRLAGK